MRPGPSDRGQLGQGDGRSQSGSRYRAAKSSHTDVTLRRATLQGGFRRTAGRCSTFRCDGVSLPLAFSQSCGSRASCCRLQQSPLVHPRCMLVQGRAYISRLVSQLQSKPDSPPLTGASPPPESREGATTPCAADASAVASATAAAAAQAADTGHPAAAAMPWTFDYMMFVLPRQYTAWSFKEVCLYLAPDDLRGHCGIQLRVFAWYNAFSLCSRADCHSLTEPGRCFGCLEPFEFGQRAATEICCAAGSGCC